MIRDPRQLFTAAVGPIVDDILSQWTPPLADQHFVQLQRELSDEIFGRGMKAVEVDGRMFLDDAGDAVLASVSQGGTGPYRVIIRYTIVEMRQLTP
jgi:hypothetical protein